MWGVGAGAVGEERERVVLAQWSRYSSTLLMLIFT